MLDFIIAILLTPYALVAVLLIGAVFDHNDNHFWPIVSLAGAGAIVYFSYTIPLVTILYGAGAWLVAGILYSWIAWTMHCREVTKDYRENRVSRDVALAYVRPSHLRGQITYWVVAWPLSLTSNVLGNAFTWIGSSVQFVFGKMYSAVSENSVKKIDKIADERGEK